MLVVLLSPLVLASAERPLPRVDDAIRTRRYWAVEGDGPARPRWRNRRGAHQCWTWPDGVAEHCDKYDGRAIIERRHFGAAGRLLTTTTLSKGVPDTVTVHGITDVEVEVAGWVEHPVGGLTLLAPTADGDRWPVEDGEVRVAVVQAQAGSLFGDPFRDELRAWCACVVEDRGPAWIDARVGVRYRVRHPHPTAPSVGEVWAVPQGDRVVMIGFVVAGAPDLGTVESRLAGGRATVALARWAQEAP